MASLKDELRGFGKAAAGLAFPDNRNVTMTITASGEYWFRPMYAPFDGWIKATVLVSSAGVLEIQGEETYTHCAFFSSNQVKGCVMIPVRKGERFSIGSGLAAAQVSCIAISARNQ